MRGMIDGQGWRAEWGCRPFLLKRVPRSVCQMCLETLRACFRPEQTAGAQAFYQAARLRAEQGEPVEAALCWMGVGAARPRAACMCLQKQASP